jgi:hypothetical protein
MWNGICLWAVVSLSVSWHGHGTIAQSAGSRDGVGDYVLEQKLDERTTFLRWKGTIDGRKLESLERLVERTIASGPFPSVKIFRDKMRAGLGDVLPSYMWDDAN